MRSNRELRAEAWKIVRSQWLWRLLTVGLLLNGIGQMASWFISRMFLNLGAQSWNDFYLAKVKAMQSGLDYAVPSLRMAGEMTGVTLCQYFIAYIFAAILVFGFAGVALKATRNVGERWLADSFAGFKRPLELAWLMFSVNVRVMFWSLLFLIPGLVAAYRYRQAWYFKCEHPDWGASACIRASAQMMKGFKGRAFFFDLSYFVWFLLVLVLTLAGIVLSALGTPVATTLGSLAGGAAGILLLFVLCYFFVGRAVFYRELAQTASPVDANPGE